MTIETELDIVDSGKVTTPAPVGTNVLNDSTKNWATNVHRYRAVRIFKGPSVGQFAYIESNTQKSLVIKGAWTAPLTTQSQYVILALNIAEIIRQTLGAGSDVNLPANLDELKGKAQAIRDRLNGPSVVLEEMAPFNTLYLPLAETATAESTTTIDHYPAENRAWYVSKVYITTTTNTTAKLKIKCDNAGVLTDVEATVPKATAALEIDLKAEYGMPLRVMQLTAEYVNDGAANEDQTLIIKGVEVIGRW